MPLNGNGNGHELVVSECRSQPADTRLLARLQALDCEAQSQWIASCDRPQELKTLLDEIKSMQEVCARLLAEYYEERVKLFRLEVRVRCRLQEIFDGMEIATGPGRGQRIRTSRKLSQLESWGFRPWEAYEYRGILESQPADIEIYVTTCRAEHHRMPTTHGLLNATRQRQMLERTVRDRPWPEVYGAPFGCDVTEGAPSQMALAHETFRQSCMEDCSAHIAALLAEKPEREQDFIVRLIQKRYLYLQNFVQGYYERRGRPDEQRRFVAQLRTALEAENAPAPTNSSERDETTRTNAVAIPAGTTDAATVN